jgi:hypothetical protein
MAAKILRLPLLCVCSTFLYACAAGVESHPDCATIEYIETLNESVLEKRVVHITGKNAVGFVALDPVWSRPDFDNVPYRHEEDMANIRDAFKTLTKAGVDEVIVWKFRRPGLGVATVFKAGCAVRVYGEPDSIDKLDAMHEVFLLISRHGIDDPSVRKSIKQLLAVDNYTPDEDKIDKIINKVRPLITLNTEH